MRSVLTLVAVAACQVGVGWQAMSACRQASAQETDACQVGVEWQAKSLDEENPGDSLPEPAYHFAKKASLRVTELERGWVELADGFSKLRADFTISATNTKESSLREGASRVRSAGQKLLAGFKQMGQDLERFKDCVTKAGTCYRNVAAVYKENAAEARSDLIREDYLQLAKVYEARAQAATERIQKLALPDGYKAVAELIEEGNVFLERFEEALSIGPVAAKERALLAERLCTHGDRCMGFMLQLSSIIEEILEGAETPGFRQKPGGERPAPVQPVAVQTTACKELSYAKRTVERLRNKGADLLAGAWSTSRSVQGGQCRQIISLNADGTCTQLVYSPRPSRAGALIASGNATFELDGAGVLTFFQGGFPVERGTVTFLGKDRWVYTILENVTAPQLVGMRLTFAREVQR